MHAGERIRPACMPRPGGHDQHWVKGGLLVHVPVDIHAGTVVLSIEVVEGLLEAAGFRRDE